MQPLSIRTFISLKHKYYIPHKGANMYRWSREGVGRNLLSDVITPTLTLPGVGKINKYHVCCRFHQ